MSTTQKCLASLKSFTAICHGERGQNKTIRYEIQKGDYVKLLWMQLLQKQPFNHLRLSG